MLTISVEGEWVRPGVDVVISEAVIRAIDDTAPAVGIYERKQES